MALLYQCAVCDGVNNLHHYIIYFTLHLVFFNNEEIVDINDDASDKYCTYNEKLTEQRLHSA